MVVHLALAVPSDAVFALQHRSRVGEASVGLMRWGDGWDEADGYWHAVDELDLRCPTALVPLPSGELAYLTLMPLETLKPLLQLCLLHENPKQRVVAHVAQMYTAYELTREGVD